MLGKSRLSVVDDIVHRETCVWIGTSTWEVLHAGAVELWTTDPPAVSAESPDAAGETDDYPDIPSPYYEDCSSPHHS